MMDYWLSFAYERNPNDGYGHNSKSYQYWIIPQNNFRQLDQGESGSLTRWNLQYVWL